MNLAIESSVTFLPCRDLEQTRRFYQDILDMKLFQQAGGSLIVDTNYGYLGFVQYDDGRPMASGVCLSFNCPDRAAVDQAYQALKDQPACRVQGPPQHHAKFPVYSFFFQDPNGYTLEFQKLD